MSRGSLARLLTVAHPDPDVQRRGQLLVLIDLILLGFCVVACGLLLLQPEQRGTVVALLAIIVVLVGSLLMAVRARIAIAAGLLLAPLVIWPVLIVLARGSLIVTPFFLALSVFVGSLVLRPGQVWVVGLLGMAGLGLIRTRVGPNPVDGALYPNLFFGSALMIVQATLLGYLGARANDRALRASCQAQEQARVAQEGLEQANLSLELEVAVRTADLQQALAELGARAVAQEQLLAEITEQRELIRRMSVPVLPVSAATLVMPLVGALDGQRLADLQSQALAAVERARARELIFDITGVPLVDTQVARGLVQTIQALRLLGAEAVLVGVRPEVAQTMVGQGLAIEGVRTASTLQAALAVRPDV